MYSPISKDTSFFLFLTLQIAASSYLLTFSSIQLARIMAVEFLGAFYLTPSNSGLWEYPLIFDTLVFTCTLFPIVEELVFRKLLLNFLNIHLPEAIALAISAAVFALVHFTDYKGNAIDVFILGFNHFTMGMVLGYLYLRTAKLIYPIIVHMLHNLFVSIPKPNAFYIGWTGDSSGTMITAATHLLLSLVAVMLLLHALNKIRLAVATPQ